MLPTDDDELSTADAGMPEMTEATGTLTFDGDQLALENMTCTRVDGLWAFTSDVAGGARVILGVFGGATVTSDDEEWRNRGGDEFDQLDHSGNGVSGQNVMYLVGEDSQEPTDAELTADISC